MKLGTDSLTLKLHVADGTVWVGEGVSLPTTTRMPVQEYVDSVAYRKMDSVRIIGSVQNAPLIARLYGRIPIELVTPLVCPTATMRNDPAAAMYFMRRGHLAPSQGGFHVMESSELSVYAIAAMLYTQTPDDFPTQSVALAKQHPLWHILNFPRFLSEECLAAIIGLVRDPRWYIDSNYPNRSAKLNNYLGLNPRTQAGVSLTGAPPWRRHQYCRTVTTLWYDTDRARAVIGRGIKHMLQADAGSCGDGPLGTDPRDFLWRIWYHRFSRDPTGPSSADIVAAELRASQSFVSYMRLTWLSLIYANSPSIPEQGAPLFRPDDFFDVVEAQAYKHYILGRCS